MSLKKETLRLNIKYGIMQALLDGLITVYNYTAYFRIKDLTVHRQNHTCGCKHIGALLQPPMAAMRIKRKSRN